MKTLLKEIARLYRLPPGYDLGRGGGKLKILIAAALVLPELRSKLIALERSGEINPRMCTNKLNISIDMLGGIISEFPFYYQIHEQKGIWQIFKTLWEKKGLEAALNSVTANPIHVDHTVGLVSAAIVFLRAFEYQGRLEHTYLSGVGAKTLPDPLCETLKPLRYVQHVPPAKYSESVEALGIQSDVITLISILRAHIPVLKLKHVPIDIIRINNPPVIRNKSDLITKIRRLYEDNSDRIFQAIERDESDSWEEFIHAASMESVLEQVTEGAYELGRLGQHHRKSARREPYISAACGIKSLGHCDFDELCIKAIAQFKTTPSEESAALMVFIFLYCEPSMGPLLKIDREHGMIGREMASFPKAILDPEVHQLSGKIFWLPVPDLLLSAVEMLSSALPTLESVQTFLQSIPGFKETTMSKIRNYLLYNACDYLGIGHILPRFGFFSDVESADVARSYIRLTDSLYKGYLHWMERYFPGFADRVELDKIPPSGSPRVAKLAVIREMYALYVKIISSPLPSETDTLFRHLDVAGALAHQIGVVYLGGCRNYRGDIPWFLTEKNGWIINYEKQPFLIHLPQRSTQIISHYLDFKDRCLTKLNIQKVTTSDVEHVVYVPLKLIEKPSSRHLQLLPLEWSTIKWSFLYMEGCWKYSLLDQNALRHLSMTLLYSSGIFDHHTIDAFHQRSALVLTPFSSGRLEDPLLRLGREKCSEYLYKLLTK